MTRGWQRLVQRPWLALVAALVVETLVLLLGPVDFVVSDPLWYANSRTGYRSIRPRCSRPTIRFHS